MDEKRIKITGHNAVIKFSKDGKYILIGGYDGSFKVFDVAQEKVNCKTRIKGPRNDIIIHHVDISFNNKYAAFSCLGNIYVMDIPERKTVWEYKFSRAERMRTIPFCFFNKSQKLLIPDGDRLFIHDLVTSQDTTIVLPYGAGWTNCLVINPLDTLIAYKSGNGPGAGLFDREGISFGKLEADLSDKIYVFDIATGTCSQTILVPYPIMCGGQMALAKSMQFSDNTTIIIIRKAIGLSWFDITNGAEIKRLDMKQKGFEFCMRSKIQTYKSGQLILFNNGTPKPESIYRNALGIATQYSVPLDEHEYILLDIKSNRVVYRNKIQMSPADFCPDINLFAYISYETKENGHGIEYLYLDKVESEL